jgi:PAS domain S-box-containing protein
MSPEDADIGPQLRALAEQLPAVIWTTDRDLRFTSGSGGGLVTLGLRREELIGVSLYEHFGASDDQHTPIKEHRRALAGLSNKYEFLWADRRFETRVEPFRDARGQVIGTIGMAIDTTTRKAAEDAHGLHESRTRRQDKLEAIAQLASGLAHEINNPLQSIINFAQLIHSRSNDANVREYAGGISHEVQRLAHIVRNLQCLVHQKGELPVELRLCDVVESTISLFATLMRDEGIELDIQVPSDLPAAWGNAYGVQQVLINLLTTAREALGEAPQTDHVPKLIRIDGASVQREGQGFVRLTVGHVHAPNKTHRPAPIPASRPYKPSLDADLGLTISHEIAQYNAGELSVEAGSDDARLLHLLLPLASEQ